MRRSVVLFVAIILLPSAGFAQSTFVQSFELGIGTTTTPMGQISVFVPAKADGNQTLGLGAHLAHHAAWGYSVLDYGVGLQSVGNNLTWEMGIGQAASEQSQLVSDGFHSRLSSYRPIDWSYTTIVYWHAEYVRSGVLLDLDFNQYLGTDDPMGAHRLLLRATPGQFFAEAGYSASRVPESTRHFDQWYEELMPRTTQEYGLRLGMGNRLKVFGIWADRYASDCSHLRSTDSEYKVTRHESGPGMGAMSTLGNMTLRVEVSHLNGRHSMRTDLDGYGRPQVSSHKSTDSTEGILKLSYNL